MFYQQSFTYTNKIVFETLEGNLTISLIFMLCPQKNIDDKEESNFLKH